MSHLIVYKDTDPSTPIFTTTDGDVMTHELEKIGVRFERWTSRLGALMRIAAQTSPDDTAESILRSYAPYLDALMGGEGMAGSADVVKLTPDHPQAEEIRAKFLQEHTHCENEIRMFIHGGGNFMLHPNDNIYDVRCEAGDTIFVPENTKHWYDAGEKPFFIALRVFTHTSGWVPYFTNSGLDKQFFAKMT